MLIGALRVYGGRPFCRHGSILMPTCSSDALAGAMLEADQGARSAAYPLWYASDKQRRPAPTAPRPCGGTMGRRHLRPIPASLLLDVPLHVYAFVVAPWTQLGSSASNAPL